MDNIVGAVSSIREALFVHVEEYASFQIKILTDYKM